VFRTENPAKACSDLRALAQSAHDKSWWCGG
jgi:hypothetical protein